MSKFKFKICLVILLFQAALKINCEVDFEKAPLIPKIDWESLDKNENRFEANSCFPMKNGDAAPMSSTTNHLQGLSGKAIRTAKAPNSLTHVLFKNPFSMLKYLLKNGANRCMFTVAYSDGPFFELMSCMCSVCLPSYGRLDVIQCVLQKINAFTGTCEMYQKQSELKDVRECIDGKITQLFDLAGESLTNYQPQDYPWPLAGYAGCLVLTEKNENFALEKKTRPSFRRIMALVWAMLRGQLMSGKYRELLANRLDSVVAPNLVAPAKEQEPKKKEVLNVLREYQPPNETAGPPKPTLTNANEVEKSEKDVAAGSESSDIHETKNPPLATGVTSSTSVAITQ